MIIMKRHLATAALVAAAAAATGQASAAEYLVKFKGEQELAAVANKGAEIERGVVVMDVHAAGSLAKVDLGKAAGVEEAQRLAALMARPDVAYVVPNFKLHMLGDPNDPSFAEQWSLAKVRASAAWDVTAGSRAVKVAIIDTGMDYAHPDLKDNVWTNPGEIAGNGIDDDNNGYVDDVHGYDFRDNDADPTDLTSAQNPGHGTHCAGIVGGVGNNGTGISGMSQEVSMAPLRFLGADGSGDLMAAIKAIDYAITIKADVISASWGAKVAASQATPLIEAVVRASDAGIIFVAAAANDGANNDATDMYPANVEAANLIAVAASDSADAKPTWSNYGKAKVALASPGADILSTLPAGAYGKLSGTSMATPLVAGMVALLKSQALAETGRTLTGTEMRSLLQKTGASVAIETACMCRVDAAAATAALESNALIVVPAAATYAPNATGKFSAFGGAGAGYTFQSANPAVLEVAADGSLTAKTVGETTVKVTDSAGATAESLTIRVAEASTGGGGECPLGDPTICQLLCAIEPTLPWCAK